MNTNEEEILKIKEDLLNKSKNGIVTNFKITPTQNKYLKNLLLFAIMRASKNDKISPKNYKRLIDKIFKKFLIKIINISSETDDDDDDYYEENLVINFNKILASQELLSSKTLIANISPANILSLIRKESKNLSAQDILNKILSLRDIGQNHRETPEEEKERTERELTRQRNLELQNGRQHTRELVDQRARNPYAEGRSR